MKNKIVLFVVIFLFLLPFAFSEVPVALQTKLALKILTFDKNFSRYQDPIKIGVTSDELFNGFKSLEGTIKVKGRYFTVVKIDSPSKIGGISVLYVGNNWKSNYKKVSSAVKGKNILVFAEDEECVKKGVAGVGFKVVGGKPKILINIDAAKSQGTEFPATLLKIAFIVK